MDKACKIKKLINKLFSQLKNLLLILAVCMSVFTVAGILCSQKLEVNHYTIQADISEPMRIVHLTDLHNVQLGSDNKDLIETVQSQKPDLIFLTGDMINQDDPNLSIITSLIKNLIRIAPVYYGYGNHEVSWEKNYKQSLKKTLQDAGAIALQDDYVDIDVNGDSLRIGGVMGYYHAWGMLSRDPAYWSYAEAFAEDFESTDRFKILLDHIPTAFTDWGHKDDYPVDLVFSGHYHGGMIRIPFIDQGLFAPYIGWFPPHTKGIIYGKYATCVQSAGLGTEHLIPRVFNPPEVVVADLIPMNT